MNCPINLPFITELSEQLPDDPKVSNGSGIEIEIDDSELTCGTYNA